MSHDTRNRILNAAGPVFADKGFDRSTVREICQAAGVNIASINYHFGDKERLYRATVKHARQERMTRMPMPERPPGSDPELLLADFVQTILRRMLTSDDATWQSKLMTHEVLHPTAALRDMVEEHFRPHFEHLMRVIRQLDGSGMTDMEVRQTGFSIIGQCMHYRVAWATVEMLTPPEELAANYDVEHLATHITQFSLRSIRSRAGDSLPAG